MNKLIFSIIILILLILSLSNINGQNSLLYEVIGIKDGDTIEILTPDKKKITIRLNGIDAPEKKQAYGQRSKENLSKIIFRKQVKIKSFGNDKYRRVIADIFIDSTNVNYLQVSEGFAWHYKKYSKDEKLAQLENQAQEQKLGLWKDDNPIPPWEFRKKK
jgi:micrococcal nuclease